MIKTKEFILGIFSKNQNFSAHISIILLVFLILIADVFFGKNIDRIVFWKENPAANIAETRKADLFLSYLTRLVPPLEDSIKTQNLDYLGGENIFFSKPSLPNTIASNLPRENVTTYAVSEGETYWTIAYKFEIDIDTLLWANGVTDHDSIQVGDRLLILPVNGLYYTVAEGDSINGIARAFNISADRIIEQNKLKSETLEAGTKLVLPGARKVVPKPSAPVPTYAGGSSYYTGPVAVGSGSFVWPVNSDARYITQYFGWVNRWYKHTGIDLDRRNGRDIIASDGGTVVAATYGWGGGYGNHVIIDHGNGYQTLYAHLAAIYVQAGQNVVRGQSIGLMGTTGISTGIHLHFEIRQDGRAINPLLYVR